MKKNMIGFLTLLAGITLSPLALQAMDVFDVFKAANKGNKAKTQEIIKRGNQQDENGNTALIIAIENKYFHLADELIKAGVNIDIQNNNDETALMVAAMLGYSEVVDKLLKAGANKNLYDKYYGNTALILATKYGHHEVFDILLKAGVNIDIQNKNGETALIVAAMLGHSEDVDKLLKAGADINIKTNDGYTAFMLALRYGYLGIADKIRKKGADITIKNNNGYTALMIAAENGYLEVVDTLLKAGADITIKNNDGHTALMIAKKYGYPGVVAKLQKAGPPSQVPQEKINPIKAPEIKKPAEFPQAGALVNISSKILYYRIGTQREMDPIRASAKRLSDAFKPLYPKAIAPLKFDIDAPPHIYLTDKDLAVKGTPAAPIYPVLKPTDQINVFYSIQPGVNMYVQADSSVISGLSLKPIDNEKMVGGVKVTNNITGKQLIKEKIKVKDLVK